LITDSNLIGGINGVGNAGEGADSASQKRSAH
jgi:hypothetical protein